MTYKFNYIKMGLWYRPIIPVTLRHKKIEFDYLALLDSGADFNIFHSDILRILKLNSSSAKGRVDFRGISGGGIGHFLLIDLGVGGDFITNNNLVFSNDISDNGYGILGQQGFFNNYKIEFNYMNREIILESN